MLNNDSILLASQGRVEKTIADVVKGKIGDLPDQLDQRLVALEKQVTDLQKAVKELAKRPTQAAPALGGLPMPSKQAA